ncbi:hypothetical protein K1719_028580 [Acacia pycnantha]|nr:hypothetical protein K1719_028580 [Acacia pycnantha]
MYQFEGKLDGADSIEVVYGFGPPISFPAAGFRLADISAPLLSSYFFQDYKTSDLRDKRSSVFDCHVGRSSKDKRSSVVVDAYEHDSIYLGMAASIPLNQIRQGM